MLPRNDNTTNIRFFQIRAIRLVFFFVLTFECTFISLAIYCICKLNDHYE